MTSNATLDIIRVTAMTGVVADHYLQMSDNNYLVNTGFQWGGVSVAIFFALSAYLFGEKWRVSEKKGFDVWPFLKRRFLRIYIPLWVALIFVIALEWYAHNPFDTKTIVFNFLGLSWARPFTWAGHLWYITMIVILYFLFLGLSRIRLDKVPVGLWLLSFVGLSAIMICLPNVFNSVSKVTIPHTVFFAAMVFFVGDKLMDYTNKHRMLFGTIAVIGFLCVWYLYLTGIYHTYKGVATILSSISGLSLFFALASIVKTNQVSGTIQWLSNISYELYLIHLTAIMFVKHFFTDSHCAPFYIVSLIFVIVSAALLHKICTRIYHLQIFK